LTLLSAYTQEEEEEQQQQQRQQQQYTLIDLSLLQVAVPAALLIR
jgi:hypothetical protein